MKQILLTILLCVIFIVGNAGIVLTNWPYMDVTDDCIEVFNDPDNNGIYDVNLTAYFKSFSSYANSPATFHRRFVTLGILITTPYTSQFVPFIDFSEEKYNRFIYQYSKPITIPYDPSMNLTFEYEISLVIKSITNITTGEFSYFNYENNNDVFIEFPNSMNPLGSVSEQAVKNICPLLLPDFDLPLFPKLSSTQQNDSQVKNNSDISNVAKKYDTKVFPNPFMKDFTIQYQVQQPQKVSIEVFDVKGKLIYIHNEYHKDGIYQKNIYNINKLCKGVYFCRLKYKNKIETHRIIKSH